MGYEMAQQHGTLLQIIRAIIMENASASTYRNLLPLARTKAKGYRRSEIAVSLDMNYDSSSNATITDAVYFALVDSIGELGLTPRWTRRIEAPTSLQNTPIMLYLVGQEPITLDTYPMLQYLCVGWAATETLRYLLDIGIWRYDTDEIPLSYMQRTT